jgi:hypothetical protein
MHNACNTTDSTYPHSSSANSAKCKRHLYLGGTALLICFFFLGSSSFAQTTLTPSTMSFGIQPAGVVSAPKTAIFRDTQGVPVTINSIVVSGAAAADYAWTGTCPISPSTLRAGRGCSITVTFTPSALGSRTATLTVTHSASTSPQSIALTGTGTSPATIFPASLQFPSRLLGTTSAPKTVTLINHLRTGLAITSVAASAGFAISTNTCSSSVGAGLKCAIGVTFTPTALGPRQGTLTISYGAFGSPFLVALTGAGNDTSLISVTVTPPYPSIAVGNTLQFTATGTCKNGFTEDLTAFVTWSSLGLDVATIAQGGLATGVTVGYTSITATLGSVTGSAMLVVTPVKEAFVLTGSLNIARVSHTATLLNNGMVLIAGGYNVSEQNQFLDSAELYDPMTGAFTTTGSLNTGRDGHTATLLNNGMVLIAGGGGENLWDDLATAELYNPATGAFTLTGSMHAGHYGHTATLLNNGMVLVAGGANFTGNKETIFATAELYNPATGTFTPTGSLNIARYLHTATVLSDGTVLIAGGFTYPIADQASAEIYNPATGTFAFTGSLNTDAQVGHTATLLNNGIVLIAGGGDYPDFPPGAELYDPTAGIFTYTGNLNSQRSNHTATLLNDGTVLAAGGFNSSNCGLVVRAELYDPTAGTFRYTAALNEGLCRSGDTATLLNDGTVLVAGGVAPNCCLSSAELYESATPSLVSIAVLPAVTTLPPGATQRFTAMGTFSDNSTEPLASVMWSTSDATVAQISNDASNRGVALAVAPGTETITATAGTVSGTATLTVNNP